MTTVLVLTETAMLSIKLQTETKMTFALVPKELKFVFFLSKYGMRVPTP